MTILCVNCRFCVPQGSEYHVNHICTHPANQQFSLVTGENHPKWPAAYCRERVGHCQPEAKHYIVKLEVA